MPELTVRTRLSDKGGIGTLFSAGRGTLGGRGNGQCKITGLTFFI
jgi:hypothetical protein